MKSLPANPSASFIRRNPQLYGHRVEMGPIDQNLPKDAPKATPAPKKAIRVRQSSKPLLNKLETEFLTVLQTMAVGNIRCQAKRYRLGNGIWFKPDFTCYRQGKETAYEVKGPHAFRGGYENLKVAASTWQEVVWILAWKDDGRWQYQTVLP